METAGGVLSAARWRGVLKQCHFSGTFGGDVRKHQKMSANVKDNICLGLLMAFCVAFVFLTVFHLHVHIDDPELHERFTTSDSLHYLNGAKEVLNSFFPFEYIKNYPHREILYPSVVAIPLYFFGENFIALGAVSIVFFCVAAVITFFAVKELYSDSIAALFSSGLILFNRFSIFNSTYQLLTEGMFIACLAAVFYFFLSYFRKLQYRYLVYMAAGCGIAQIIRPNGFFVFGVLVFCILVDALLSKERVTRPGEKRHRRLMGVLAACCLLFVVLSAASWAPRVYFFNNPLYHGYLPNFLWADTYDQAHNYKSVYSFQDYARNHEFEHVVTRIVVGLEKSFLDYPLDYMGWHVWLAMVLGLVIAVWKKRRDILMFTAAYVLAMAPIVWTVCSNPTPRIGFSLSLPFSAYLGGYALSFFLRQRNVAGACTRLQRCMTRGGSWNRV